MPRPFLTYPTARHSERSRPIFSSAFVPAKASACGCEESLFSFFLSWCALRVPQVSVSHLGLLTLLFLLNLARVNHSARPATIPPPSSSTPLAPSSPCTSTLVHRIHQRCVRRFFPSRGLSTFNLWSPIPQFPIPRRHHSTLSHNHSTLNFYYSLLFA